MKDPVKPPKLIPLDAPKPWSPRRKMFVVAVLVALGWGVVGLILAAIAS